jgi:hypothetical protein
MAPRRQGKAVGFADGSPGSAFEVRRGQIYEKKDERRFRFFSRRRP